MSLNISVGRSVSNRRTTSLMRSTPAAPLWSILPMEPKDLVAQGYDRIADPFASWAFWVRIEEHVWYTALILEGLPKDANFLEVSSGNGLPATQKPTRLFHVTKVDISAKQIELARRSLTKSNCIYANMTILAFLPAGFDAIAGF